MTTDPILAEVYRWKEEGAREVDYDVDKLFDALDKISKEHPEAYVNLHENRLRFAQNQRETS